MNWRVCLFGTSRLRYPRKSDLAIKDGDKCIAVVYSSDSDEVDALKMAAARELVDALKGVINEVGGIAAIPHHNPRAVAVREALAKAGVPWK